MTLILTSIVLVPAKGEIGGPDFLINQHLNDFLPLPSHDYWRNYKDLRTNPTTRHERLIFDRHVSTVKTYDLVSQYATAASYNLPVGNYC